MPLYLRDIKLDLDEPEEVLRSRIAARLKVAESSIRSFAAVRRSLDARRRGPLSLIYCVQVALDGTAEREQRIVERLHRPDVTLLTTRSHVDPEPGSTPLKQRPVIIGFGPAGMFAAYRLAQWGYRPVVLERGQNVRVRHRDVLQKFYRQGLFNPESNLLFGEGGAGAYSDGKLYTRINDPLVPKILEVLYHHGADPDILIDGKPHIGSDRLPNICMRLRRRIEQLGGEVRFGARVEDVLTHDDGSLRALQTATEVLPVECAVLAIGHSARDTIRRLAARGVRLEAKPFQLGVRIEHPQDLVDRWQYAGHAGHQRLPPADYHLVAKNVAPDRRDLFTFCMCPGGVILPTNESPELIATNGASRAARGGPFANSGLVMTIPMQAFQEDPLAGLDFQQKWEARAYHIEHPGYAVPAQRAEDYLQRRRSSGKVQTSYPFGAKWTDVRELLPGEVAEALERALRMLDQRLPGFAGCDALITAPETRASAPLRILRDSETRQSPTLPGLYPVGEGAGYAGGIVSAAVDGWRTADQIIRSYAAAR